LSYDGGPKAGSEAQDVLQDSIVHDVRSHVTEVIATATMSTGILSAYLGTSLRLSKE